MISDCTFLPYSETQAFSKIVLDYLSGSEQLKPFYQHPVSLAGMAASITARKSFDTDRTLLVTALRAQYAGYEFSPSQEVNLLQLLDQNTFTITTAHQPNIFTGHLYFIYKILHTIKLCAYLQETIPGNHYVPVFYMGSEDADLDELGHINIGGEKLSWQTQQSGAVGRMHTKGLEAIIERLEGEFGSQPFGEEMADLCRKAYLGHPTIQEATLYLVNELFKDYGLLVLIPDNAALKKAFQPIVERELLSGFSHRLVAETIDKIGLHYKVQAGGRDINLFYLADNGSRERIELRDDRYVVAALGLAFSKQEILAELDAHPERFSANVILRGVFQETILPNIAFIGGGGELAYWLELKSVFEAAGVPYPVLLLRNSFLMIGRREKRLIDQLGLSLPQLFDSEISLQNFLAKKAATTRLELHDEEQEVNDLYSRMQYLAAAVDLSLQPHVAALHTRALKDIHGLEKKMLQSEKRKNGDQSRQLATLRSRLFPQNSLQERVDNFMPYYARYGKEIIRVLYEHSRALDAAFGVLHIED